MSWTWEPTEKEEELDYQMWLAVQKCPICREYGHLSVDCPKWLRRLRWIGIGGLAIAVIGLVWLLNP